MKKFFRDNPNCSSTNTNKGMSLEDILAVAKLWNEPEEFEEEEFEEEEEIEEMPMPIMVVVIVM